MDRSLPYAVSVVALCSASFAIAGCVAPVESPSDGDVAALESPLTPASVASSVNVLLGVPTDSDPSDDYLMDHGAYVLSYSAERNEANWVAWRVDASDLGSSGRSTTFHADSALPSSMYHVVSGDYTGSGYDRGHLCPSADRTKTAAINAVTFLMTNVHPQLHTLNAGVWEKMETFERDLASADGAEVYVVAGPLFGAHPDTIGNGVAVPDASFKIVVALASGDTAADVTKTTAVYAAIMPNQDDVSTAAWTSYITTVDEIELRSGYDFLTRVPAAVQKVIEAKRNVP